MEVVGCDPYITVNAAWSLSRAVVKAENYDEIYEKSDYITLHVPSLPSTKNLINKEAIAKMKDGVRIVNLSRDDIINTADMLEALASGKVAAYVTDFPTDELIGVEGVITIPHLGASTPESEENCAFMAAQQMVDYLENGNIRNSVNYPEIVLPRTTETRVVVLHENIPNMLAQISTALSNVNINIETLLSHSKGNNAISLFDTNSPVCAEVTAKILAIPGVRRVTIV
jgi:D-3-phosphoglycerate dehydrogenase